MIAAHLDLWTVADAAGLSPKGRGRNFAFNCPDCGRKGKASGSRAEGGPWHCWTCEAAGNALTLARRFELDGAELPRPTVQAPEATNRNGVAPSTARAAWAALEGIRDVYRGRLAAYLRDVRGWPAELADAGADVSGWAWIPEDCPDLPRSLAWTARDADRRAAFALRDAHGEVWTLERRWTAPAPPADPKTMPKAMRLRTRSEEAGGPAIFGRIPDAVAAAAGGGPIYLCEGGPDYLAAAALCRLDGRGAALGAHGHAGLRTVAAALRAALESAAVPVAGVHVLCVPHLGDPGDVGERSMAAAAAVLAGAGHVHTVHVPTDGAGRGDLADVARLGAIALRDTMRGAVLTSAPPVDLRDTDAATDTVAAALRAALEAAGPPGALALVIMPPGVGKTTAAFERAAWTALQGRRVVFALPDHENAAKKLAEFRAAFPNVPATHAKGMASLCELPAAYPDKAGAIARAAESMGRRMCEGCPLASREDCGTCEGWHVPKARRGAVTFAAHAGIASLARTMDPADLVIVDELPALVDGRMVGPAHLRTVEAGGLAARVWYRDNPAHGALAAELAAVADAIEADTPRGMYAARVQVSDVLEALRQRSAAMRAAAGVLAEIGADPDPDRPPMPRPDDARRGAADRWPDTGAWTFVRAVARALDGAEPGPDLATVCLCLDGAGAGWAFEARRLYELPAGVRVLALDATGEISRAEWDAVAARHGRTLAPVTVTATGETPAAADHYRTERLRTGRLWARHGRRVRFLADAAGGVRNALLRAAGPAPCALGVLTHKPAADALRWGVALAIDPDAAPPDGAAFEADDVHALAVAELAAELAGRGWTVEVGHFGRDDRASNAFERVDVLAVLGAPRPDWGAAAEDARVLGIDPDALGDTRTLAALVQAIARARHLRRPSDARVRLFLAADCDAPAGAELPGVVWTVEAADRSHAPTVAAIDAAREVAAWADRAECLDVPAVLAVLTPHVVGRRVAERLCRMEAERRGWVPTRVGRAGRTVYTDPLHREKRCNFNAVPTHGGSFSPPEGDAREGGALLLDPMSVHRREITGDLPVHGANDDRETPPRAPATVEAIGRGRVGSLPPSPGPDPGERLPRVAGVKPGG